jgi:hypothetical protein
MGIVYQESEKLKSYGASMEETMLKATGKTLEEWVAIAKTCPFTKHSEKIKWFKENFGILQNRAILIFSTLEGTQILGSSEPDLLVDQLFLAKPEARKIYDLVAYYCQKNFLDGIISPRKTYVGFQHKYQYAAAIPTKNGLTLGLALPDTFLENEILGKSKKQLGGGDRLKYSVQLSTEASFTKEVIGYLTSAYNNS